MIIFLRTRAKFTHFMNGAFILTQELSRTAIPVIGTRSPSEITNRSQRRSQFTTQSHSRNHHCLLTHGYKMIFHFNHSVSIHFIRYFPLRLRLRKIIGSLQHDQRSFCMTDICKRRSHQFLLACFLPNSQHPWKLAARSLSVGARQKNGRKPCS